MRSFESAVVLAAATFGVVTSALGGVTGSISVTAAPILNPATATYSNPATGFKGTVGYQVDIQNVGRNTNNSVRFTATSNIQDAAEFASYEFDSAEGVICTANKGPVDITLDCAIGTLTSGQKFPTFYLFFKSPAFVSGNGTGDTAGTDFVNFSSQVFFAEGGNGPKSTPKNGFTPLQAAAVTVLGTSTPDLVRSVVLASGGTFFTGNQGIAGLADIHATKSVVPPLAVHTTAEIIETGANCISPNVLTCFSSQITIPGSFTAAPYLTTRLTQAIQNIKTQTVTVPVSCPPHDDDDHYHTYSTCTTTTTQLVPIEQIVITYLADTTLTNPNPSVQTVVLCVPLAGPPQLGVPCISNRTAVNDLASHPIRYEWTFISFQNGRITIN